MEKARALAAGRPLLHWTAAAVARLTDDLIVVRRVDQRIARAEGVVWREAVDREAVRAAVDVDVAIPVVNGREEPLAAAYRVSCLESVRSALSAGEGRPVAILKELQVRRLTAAELRAEDPRLVSLTNINYPEDLERVERELEARAAANS